MSNLLLEFAMDGSLQIVLAGVGIGVVLVLLVRLTFSPLQTLMGYLQAFQIDSLGQQFIQPNQDLLKTVVAIALLDLLAVFLPKNAWTSSLEILVSLSLLITFSWLASKLFKQFFDLYVLNAAVNSGRKISSELLVLIKWIANLAILFAGILFFAQTHHVNLVGLFASLGIGGLAVAFAAQKTLEQVLGGIVLYVDRPFGIDDYIGLPDGTFGRVESIGLRSTRIRTSGKGTLMIVPNSALTQVNIENFTGAKKVMSILYLTFYRAINSQESALIRQIIIESTHDIFGIDSRNTEVVFKQNGLANSSKTQAQVTFFILGSGEVSMELRRQLLDIAIRTITQRLQDYGIEFEVEEPTIYVDSPITI
jgi:MscS family membrane protein